MDQRRRPPSGFPAGHYLQTGRYCHPHGARTRYVALHCADVERRPASSPARFVVHGHDVSDDADGSIRMCEKEFPRATGQRNCLERRRPRTVRALTSGTARTRTAPFSALLPWNGTPSLRACGAVRSVCRSGAFIHARVARVSRISSRESSGRQCRLGERIEDETKTHMYPVSPSMRSSSVTAFGADNIAELCRLVLRTEPEHEERIRHQRHLALQGQDPQLDVWQLRHLREMKQLLRTSLLDCRPSAGAQPRRSPRTVQGADCAWSAPAGGSSWPLPGARRSPEA